MSPTFETVQPSGRKHFVYGFKGARLFAAYAYGSAVGSLMCFLRAQGWKCSYRKASKRYD